MFSVDELEFYNRQILLKEIGENGQLALKSAKVLVIGAGGLGCPVLTYLASSGIGTIGIVDGDKVHPGNLHRQTLFGYSQIGNLKAVAALERLRDINPHIIYKPFPTLLTAANALRIITDFDIVVDATDNFAARYLINDACVILSKPFVFASIDKFQGQLSVFNYDGKNAVKGPTYRCVFPNPPNPRTAPNCFEVGVLGVLPGVIGSFQANEVIKMITGLGEVLSGKLLLIDLLNNRFMSIRINRDEKEVKKVFNLQSGVSDSKYFAFCNEGYVTGFKNITREDILNDPEKDFQLVDIREKSDKNTINNSVRIPVSKLKTQMANLDKTKHFVVFCDYGITSLSAAKQLSESGFLNVYNLQGGIQQWNQSGSNGKQENN